MTLPETILILGLGILAGLIASILKKPGFLGLLANIAVGAVSAFVGIELFSSVNGIEEYNVIVIFITLSIGSTILATVWRPLLSPVWRQLLSFTRPQDATKTPIPSRQDANGIHVTQKVEGSRQVTMIGVQNIYNYAGIQPAEMTTDQTSLITVFIAYAHADGGSVAGKLEANLRTYGFNTWWDNGISPGADWDEAIQTALEYSDAMVIVMTEGARQSRHTNDEWHYALDVREIPVIPFLTPGFDPQRIPLGLRRKQWIDARLDYNKALQQLIKALHEIGK